MIKRILQEKIAEKLFKGKIIIIYGARQVGKTTLAKGIVSEHPNSLYLNCDEPDIRDKLTNNTSTELKRLLGKSNLIIIDEAQRIHDIGLTLKLMVDTFPEKQIIATGSSSFDLSNSVKEPLTGRKYEFLLYPFALQELRTTTSKIEIERTLEANLIYGLYPDIVLHQDETLLKELADSYLYKDILQYQNIKNPELLRKLLQALALQVGSEVSYTELASLLGVDKKTIESYISILEQAFIIFRIGPFSRNLRNELKKLRKIYFYDVGIRNALINNFNPLHLRNDAGALFENFMIVERLKNNNNQLKKMNYYFWRTHQQKEIDLLEESSGCLRGYEFKLTKDNYKTPKEFIDTYAGSSVCLINKNNYSDFLDLN